MDARVAADAHADRAGLERDHPDPVALPHQVVGALHALAAKLLRHTVDPPLLIGPLVDDDAAVKAPPRRVDVVRVVLLETEGLLEDVRAARGIHYPARAHLLLLAALLEVDHVLRVAAARFDLADP